MKNRLISILLIIISYASTALCHDDKIKAPPSQSNACETALVGYFDVFHELKVNTEGQLISNHNEMIHLSFDLLYYFKNLEELALKASPRLQSELVKKLWVRNDTAIHKLKLFKLSISNLEDKQNTRNTNETEFKHVERIKDGLFAFLTVFEKSRECLEKYFKLSANVRQSKVKSIINDLQALLPSLTKESDHHFLDAQDNIRQELKNIPQALIANAQTALFDIYHIEAKNQALLKHAQGSLKNSYRSGSSFLFWDWAVHSTEILKITLKNFTSLLLLYSAESDERYKEAYLNGMQAIVTELTDSQAYESLSLSHLQDLFIFAYRKSLSRQLPQDKMPSILFDEDLFKMDTLANNSDSLLSTIRNCNAAYFSFRKRSEDPRFLFINLAHAGKMILLRHGSKIRFQNKSWTIEEISKTKENYLLVKSNEGEPGMVISGAECHSIIVLPIDKTPLNKQTDKKPEEKTSGKPNNFFN